MPRVSVIMPVYNGERFLRPAIESILCQTFDDFEFIIADDGSTDGSAQIIGSYQDKRIRLLKNQRNVGITKSLNVGIDSATGEYICRMDADDISLPERLEKQVAFMDSRPDVALAGSAVELIDADGKRIGVEDFPASRREIQRRILVHNPFAHSTVIIRSSVLHRCGKYDDRFLHNEDYDLWLRIAAQYPVANFKEQLVRRRIHEQNITVEKETELVQYRMKTIKNAVFHYYRKPLYSIYLVRPCLAYAYRRLKQVFA